MLKHIFPFLEKEQIEYVWMTKDGSLRSKVRILNFIPTKPTISDIPQWTYNGKFTNEGDTERLLLPERMWRHPFEHGWVVWCNTACLKKNLVTEFDTQQYNTSLLDTDIYLGFEQQFYFEVQDDTHQITPSIYFDKTKKVNPRTSNVFSSADLNSKENYCSVGQGSERTAIQEFTNCALKMNIALDSVYQHISPSQWGFKLQSGEALKMSDELCITRWLLSRIAEQYGWRANFETNPSFNGIHNRFGLNSSKCITTISTSWMREAFDKTYNESKTILKPYLERMRENRENYIEDEPDNVYISFNTNRNNFGLIKDERLSSDVNPYCIVRYYVTMFE